MQSRRTENGEARGFQGGKDSARESGLIPRGPGHFPAPSGPGTAWPGTALVGAQVRSSLPPP